MSTTTHDKNQIASQAREEARRTQQLKHTAGDALDPPLAFANCHSLRSMLWRAQNQKIDLSEPATVTERPEVETVSAMRRCDGIYRAQRQAHEQNEPDAYPAV